MHLWQYKISDKVESRFRTFFVLYTTRLMSNLLFSVLLDRIILKQPLSIFKIIITIILMTGVVLVALPNLTILKLLKTDRPTYFTGAFLGLSSAATYSLKLILVFMVKSEVNPSVCLWYASIGHVFCSIWIALVDSNSSIIRGNF